jgi:hypothetical protein
LSERGPVMRILSARAGKIIIALGSLVTASLTAVEPAHAESGYSLLQNRYTGMCLSVWSGAKYDGAPVTEAPCNKTYYDQHWDISPSNNTLRNRWHDGRCLSLAPGPIADGMLVVIWQCDGGWRQRWQEKFSYETPHYWNAASVKCLAFRSAEEPPRQARVFGCVGEYRDQQWIEIPV